jgi:hypothetical protein
MDFPVIVKNDKWLEPYVNDFLRWEEKFRTKEEELLDGNPLSAFCFRI